MTVNWVPIPSGFTTATEPDGSTSHLNAEGTRGGQHPSGEPCVLCGVEGPGLHLGRDEKGELNGLYVAHAAGAACDVCKGA